MSQEQAERIGLIADRVDNLVAALTLPLPLAMHIESIKGILPEISNGLKQIVIEATGENPWEGWEDDETTD